VRAPGGCGIRRITAPGALGCRSGYCPQSPRRLAQRYSKRSPLTVLLWPQVQNYSLTKLRLILAGAMASAIQQFRGSSQRVGHQLGGSMPHPGHRWRCDGHRWLSERRRPRIDCRHGGRLRPDHRQMVATPRCLWLRLENSTPSNIKPAILKDTPIGACLRQPSVILLGDP